MNLGKTGKKGEDMVAAFLKKQGCTILNRNYSCRYGEIDIVAQKGGILLFVEVKTRKKDALVSATQAVDQRKRQRIILTAEDYLSKAEAQFDLQPRFDVAEVLLEIDKTGRERYSLNYIANAF